MAPGARWGALTPLALGVAIGFTGRGDGCVTICGEGLDLGRSIIGASFQAGCGAFLLADRGWGGGGGAIGVGVNCGC